MNDKILFVTRGGEECDEGFSYVLELARTLQAGIEVLILHPSRMTTSLDDIMMAATYAEAGDLKTVSNMLEAEQQEFRSLAEKKIGSLVSRSGETGVELFCRSADGDLTAAVKDHLKNRPYIDMVLLSPSLSDSRKTFNFKKLIKNISKPIVSISRPATAKI